MDYRNQPDSYPSSYDHGGSYDGRSYMYTDPHPHDSQRPPSQSSSTAYSDTQTQPIQQPLRNALNNAFDKSDTARAVDPDLIAQITAEVKKSVLDEIKMSGVAGVTGTAQPAPPHPYGFPPPQAATSLPPRNVYTPPSPSHPDLSASPPDPLARDPLLDGADDTPTPRYQRSSPIDIPHESAQSRPAPATRMPTEETYTPIEKMWQRLFDQKGQPTPRLGQFLRGLAVHLIEDYEPKKSLVISPAKMLRFYNDVKLDQEIYPWNTIFGKLPYSTLSKIYREMRCQHHLIQEHTSDQPQIPALTPDGFEEWMTAMIQAYPDTEYERLSRAVLDMPISNADDCKERFPKELPRRLFPQQEHLQAQQRCAAVLSAEGVGPLRRAPTFPPPPPMSQSATSQSGLERERSPYTGQTNSQVIDSDDDEPLAVPIERERKPYTAAPGGGKLYDDQHSQSVPPDAPSHQQRRRAQSTAGQTQWVPPSAPPLQSQPPPRTGSMANGRRPRSPSFSGYGTRSDPNVRDMPGSYYASNVYDSEEENRRFAKDAEMRRNEWAGRHESDAAHRRRGTTGTDSSFESQPRSSTYDEDYYRDRGRGYDGRAPEPRRYG